MTKIQPAILCATFFVCLMIIWLGTTAARSMPPTLQNSTSASAQPILKGSAGIDSVSSSNNKNTPKTVPSVKTNACPLSQKYPDSILQWCELIQKYAQENELAVELIAAVMLQESGGDPLSYSESGAVGLLQVMPRDGIAESFQCVNGPCFSSRPTIAELQDPDFNISFGTRMLAGLIRKYGSNRDGLKYYGPAGVGYYYADKVLAIVENYR